MYASNDLLSVLEKILLSVQNIESNMMSDYTQLLTAIQTKLENIEHWSSENQVLMSQLATLQDISNKLNNSDSKYDLTELMNYSSGPGIGVSYYAAIRSIYSNVQSILQYISPGNVSTNFILTQGRCISYSQESLDTYKHGRQIMRYEIIFSNYSPEDGYTLDDCSFWFSYVDGNAFSIPVSEMQLLDNKIILPKASSGMHMFRSEHFSCDYYVVCQLYL